MQTDAVHEGTVISAKTQTPIPFETLLEDLAAVRIVYIGEIHTDRVHHKLQLQLIRELCRIHSELSVGMEMFDHSYQPILDGWSTGGLTETEFLRKVHWYANWKFDFALYREILAFIQEKRISLVGLNIPFHIPSKIAVGGIENLSEADRTHLPKDIDVSNPAHRAYVQSVFNHHPIKGRENFEDFYTTQCVWEEAMAEAIARHLKPGSVMAVLAGNGHIIHKFGIPERSFRRTLAPYRTIVLIPYGSSYDLTLADYIWLTPSKQNE